MASLRSLAWNFLKSEDGPTATEYAAMLALIALVCVGSIGALGSTMNDTFTTLASNVPPGSGS